MNLISWNVNGLRAAYKKGFEEFLSKYKPDILCLQEIKVLEEQLTEEQRNPENYSVYFGPAKRKGYSGVATYIRNDSSIATTKASFGLGDTRFDDEGRYLVTEHKDFTLYNIYIPSGTTGDIRQDFKYDFLAHLYEHLSSQAAAQRKKIILCGDFNICHTAIDIHHPKVAEKRELSGFLPDERKWMDSFSELGYHDSFRLIHGATPHNYTWWSFRANSRAKNLGWRIDYIFVGDGLKKMVTAAEIYPSVMGSDHCPISITLGDS